MLSRIRSPLLSVLPKQFPNSTPLLTLYQYAICPYCCKVKGVLDFYRIPYTTVEVNPLTKSELNSVDYRQKKVPFAQFSNGATLGESSLIIQELIDRKLVPSDSGIALSHLPILNRVSMLMFPNITRNISASWQAFSYVQQVPSFTPFQKLYNHVLGAVAMVFANGRLKRKYGVLDARQELAAEVKKFLTTINDPKIAGPATELLEIQMFGTVRAIEGLDTHQFLMEHGNGEFGLWYEGMVRKLQAGKAVKSGSRSLHGEAETPVAAKSASTRNASVAI